MKATEHPTQNAIIRWLALHDHLRAFRQNTGVATYKGRTVRFGVPGQADVRVVVQGGYLWEIEVKSPTGRQSAAQQKYQAMLESLGAEYTLARCVEDAWRAATTRWPELPWRTPAEVME